jgi:dihydrofolate synthase/folylpolyglutamate synthase
MNYTESMDYLKGLTKFGINLGLERIQELLRRMGHPEKETEFIHVGGTNGKGSTAVMIAEILKQSGMKVGLFTSPHLYSYNERIRINGEKIAEEDIACLLTDMRFHLDGMVASGYEHPTEFEVSTALALCYFAREKVDLAVIEVGMGGEIDSTNVILPRLAVITNVGMDHMDYLGTTLEEIAQVKAGIIKPGCDVITAEKNPEALRVIRDYALGQKASLWEEGKDFWVTPLEYSIESQYFNCTIQGTVFNNLRIRLRGKYQLMNAVLAVAAAVKMGVSSFAIRKGLDQARWPCRLDIVHERPLVVIDAAHNYQGIKVLVDSLKQYWPYEKKILVLGMLADKEREKAVAEIAPLVEKVVVTKPNSPRAGAWYQVADFISVLKKEVILEENISKAVDIALDLAQNDKMVVITGSIYMVAEARAYLWEKR